MRELIEWDEETNLIKFFVLIRGTFTAPANKEVPVMKIPLQFVGEKVSNTSDRGDGVQKTDGAAERAPFPDPAGSKRSKDCILLEKCI